MLPKPRLDLSDTPGNRPISLSSVSWQTSLGLGTISRYSSQILIFIPQTNERYSSSAQIIFKWMPGIWHLFSKHSFKYNIYIDLYFNPAFSLSMCAKHRLSGRVFRTQYKILARRIKCILIVFLTIVRNKAMERVDIWEGIIWDTFPKKWWLNQHYN